ncbi:hypothetical protein [Kribbella sp. VKM Ac-2571]|uniref:hypothetical protein n=1 Tax=Kribbella sp. VKM Ac-2571 TaxID=2512222 RepID=UPI00105B809A|nr:hypothetical protein [Kribbella sp. VKM Ac-2571]
MAVDHDQPLRNALTLSWNLPDLTATQRASVVLGRWNPQANAWAYTPERPVWRGNVLTAAVREFSILTWFADIGQTTGQITGTRVDEPKCSTNKLPPWVTGTVDPDKDLAASAIRVCFEPDKDSRVTVRIANNRTFSQQMSMVHGGQPWAWVWRGDDEYDPKWIVYSIAQQVLDTSTRHLIPPLKTHAVGIARPKTPGSYHIEARASVDLLTVLADAVAFGANESRVAVDSPAVSAAIQALYECGGKELLDKPNLRDVAELGRTVANAIGGCAKELMEPDSEFGIRFEKLSRALIAKGGLSQTAAIQSNRVARELVSVFRVITVGKILFYLSDQFANALVGPLAWSINGRGTPEVLGHWKPTCTSLSTDSNRLYRNLALQDRFADTSKELWQFKDFEDAAETAVEPLEDCSQSHRSGLASLLPTDWADQKAASIVATAIMKSLSGVTPKSLLRAQAPAMCTHPSGRLVNGSLPLADPLTQGYVAIRLKGVQYTSPLPLATTDLNSDGVQETVAVYDCSAGGVTWPQTIAVYGPGPTLLGSVDLGKYVEAEHSDVRSFKVQGNRIAIQWISYQGADFDREDWSGYLKFGDGKVTVTDRKRN